MILSRKDLMDFLQYEKKLYRGERRLDNIVAVLCGDYTYCIWKFVKALRYSEYHLNNSSIKAKRISIKTIMHNLCFIIWRRIKNNRGKKLNIEIFENCFDKGLLIYHSSGGILVNGGARIGKNCKLHGNNCIGNNGESEFAPVIGDDINLGYGAVVIGGIVLGNDITIAANAVVVKSFGDNALKIGGVPATIIKVK